MHVALVSPEQQESLVDLLCELNAYYCPGVSASRETVRDHAVQNLLPDHSPHRLVVASHPDGRVFGLAAIAIVHSLVEPEPQNRTHCQMKELYVSASERSRGAGRALMAYVARFALERGCHRIDWPVKASNARGIAFYESIGARRVEDRLSFRLAEPHLAELAVFTA